MIKENGQKYKVNDQIYNIFGKPCVLWHKIWYSLIMNEDVTQHYSIAYDLGTTTLVGYLCSDVSCKVVSTFSLTNPQTEYGDDVISRITFVTKSKKNVELMANALKRGIVEITEELLNSIGFQLAQGTISKILLVGNPVIMGSIASVSFEDICNDVIKLPSIGNYVGADALSAMLMVDSQRKNDDVELLVDIGTNTEIVLFDYEGNLATSAAAGPALEGAGITCGMRAASGAIDYVTLTNGVDMNSDIVLHTISEVTPVGICGSGILSLMACLLDAGIIDNTGYIISKKEALEKKVPYKLAAAICEKTSDMHDGLHTTSCRYFKLTQSVIITQEDIRNVQLAKSAIRSGIEILISMKKLTSSVIGKIHLAGAFGNHITIDSAIKLGLLPDITPKKIEQSGNLAGLGAVAMLVDDDLITRAMELKDTTLTVPLDEESAFKDMFLKYMSF